MLLLLMQTCIMLAKDLVLANNQKIFCKIFGFIKIKVATWFQNHISTLRVVRTK